MSDYDLSGLSAAERAALEEDGDELELSPAAEAEDEADTDDAEDDAAGAAGDTGEETGDADEAEAPADPTSQSFSVPTGDLAEISAQLDKMKAAQDELEAAYESGDSELTFSEFKAKQRELNNAILDLNAEKAEVQAIQKVNAAYQQQWWANEIRSFKRDAAREGVDYDADPKLAAEWDKAVKYLGNDPDNADKDASWFLKEGHEMVKARFRLGKAEIPSQQSRLSKVDEALAQRRQKAGEPPKTLASLPQAGIESEGQGEFSHLEQLSGLDLEKALARMTKEQQDRYLTAE
jgi:hypothetical protein